MIRCVRIWTGDDQNSHAEEGFIDLAPGARGDFLTGKLADLIVVGGNPLEDIQNVRQLKLVLKEGVVVSDKRERR